VYFIHLRIAIYYANIFLICRGLENIRDGNALDQQQLEALIEANEHSALSLSFHIFETLPSTNQMLWKLIDRGATPGTVVIATQQTAGRGQWGRQWQSSAGGLYLSLALAPNLPATHSAQLTICSAWGIATELRSYDIPVLIKWPNDLILQKRKLGGILTETRVHKGRITKAVVGVGINWANSVPETGINLRSFFDKPAPNTVELTSPRAALDPPCPPLLGGLGEGSPAPPLPPLPNPLLKGEGSGRNFLAEGGLGRSYPTSIEPTPTKPPITSLEMLAAIAIQGILSGYQHASPEKIEAMLPSYLELLSSKGRPVVVDGCPGVVVGVAPTGDLRVCLHSSAAASEICIKPGTISLGYDR
jgi:biotin-(acetyl-CoA carboxylase) ligase